MKPPRVAAKPSHPFYCHRRNCRKTVVATPNYLSDSDWKLLERIVSMMLREDRAAFDALFHSATEAGSRRANAEAFFYRMVGWPEGLSYYVWGTEGARQRYFDNFIARDLPGFRAALDAHNPQLALV